MRFTHGLWGALRTIVQITLVSAVGLAVGALVISPASNSVPWLMPVVHGLGALTLILAAAMWYRSRKSSSPEAHSKAGSRAIRQSQSASRTPQAVQALVRSGRPLPEIVRRTKMPHDAISLLLSISKLQTAP